MTPTHQTLANALLATRLPADEIRRQLLAIHRGLLETSRYVRDANSTSIHLANLEWLFGAYDDRFFAGLVRER